MTDTSTQAGNNRRIQTRAARPDGFTDAKRQVFLDHLAGCSNMTRAAAAAGISTNSVNYHRRRDPAFAAQVAEALDAGYETLEAAMMERAATGGGGYAPGPDAAAVPGPESVDTALGLHLLALRKRPGASRTGAGGRRPRRATDTELDTAILAKLDVLDRRMKAGRPLGFRGRKGAVKGTGA